MSNGEMLSREDRIRNALSTLSELGVSRGDSFDIGNDSTEVENPRDIISTYLSNPQQLGQLFHLTDKQAENVSALITGGGSALTYKALSRYVGSELAGAIGGYLGGLVARKLIGK